MITPNTISKKFREMDKVIFFTSISLLSVFIILGSILTILLLESNSTPNEQLIGIIVLSTTLIHIFIILNNFLIPGFKNNNFKSKRCLIDN